MHYNKDGFSQNNTAPSIKILAREDAYHRKFYCADDTREVD